MLKLIYIECQCANIVMNVQVQYCKGCDDFNLFLNGKKIEMSYKRTDVNQGKHNATAILWEGIDVDDTKEINHIQDRPAVDDKGNLRF